jgi:hypothetical protein
MVFAAGCVGAAPITTFSVVPFPNWMEMEPESTSEELVISLRLPKRRQP